MKDTRNYFTDPETNAELYVGRPSRRLRLQATLGENEALIEREMQHMAAALLAAPLPEEPQ